MGEVDGKVALVSGGARGLGEAYVRALVTEGARVMFGDVLDHEGRAVARDLGDRAAYVNLDVTQEGQWTDAVAQCESQFGPPTVLVNNAGIVDMAPLDETDPADFERVIAVNLTGTFLGMRAVIPGMKRVGGGSIINISSAAGLRGYPWLAAYTASKHAVRGLTKVAALELGRRNIRVNSVHPGQIDTPMTAGLDAQFDHIAMGRRGTPNEVANLILFLASEASSFCTGAEFIVDGGETAGLPSKRQDTGTEGR